MKITLATLPLCPEHLEVANDRIRHLAYGLWQNAGCHNEKSLDYWLEAEKAWIEHEYVPERNVDGNGPCGSCKRTSEKPADRR